MNSTESKPKNISNKQIIRREKNRYLVIFEIPTQRLRPHVSFDFDVVSFTKNNKSYSYIAIEYSEIVKFRKLGILWDAQFSISSYFTLVKKRNEENVGFYYWGGTVGNKLWTLFQPKKPWYLASYGKTTNNKNNLTLISNAKELSCEIDLNTRVQKSLTEKDKSILNNFWPEFMVYEKTNSANYKIEDVHYDTDGKTYKFPLLAIKPNVYKDMCLLTDKAEEQPGFIYFFENLAQFTTS